MLSFRKFLVVKKFIDKREGEVSRFSFEIFLSHSAENSSRNLSVFQKISGIEKC